MAGYSDQSPYGLLLCHQGEQAVVDIVFVHGLSGDRESAWTHQSSGIFWPRDLLKNVVPESRIVSFGYGSDTSRSWSFTSKKRLSDHAQDLIRALATMRSRSRTVLTPRRLVYVILAKPDQTQRPIIFVAHGIGGLLVEEALVQSRNSSEIFINDISSSSKAIAFMGTPHSGSDIGKWSLLLRNFKLVLKDLNPDMIDVLKPESEVLARIQTDFHTMLRVWRNRENRELNITCFYEELGYRGSGPIVPMHSAILPAHNRVGIHANHEDMTKFSSESERGFQSISGELWGWVDDIVEEANEYAA